MFGKIQKMLRNRKGFTLVELIVVIAILGILAAVAVPRLTGFTGDAKKKADLANTRMIQNAVEMYTAENDGLPDSAAKMTSMVGKYLNDVVPSPQEDTNDEFYMDENSGKVELKNAAGADDIEVKK